MVRLWYYFIASFVKRGRQGIFIEKGRV